jgi:hypothetical protein
VPWWAAGRSATSTRDPAWGRTRLVKIGAKAAARTAGPAHSTGHRVA